MSRPWIIIPHRQVEAWASTFPRLEESHVPPRFHWPVLPGRAHVSRLRLQGYLAHLLGEHGLSPFKPCPVITLNHIPSDSTVIAVGISPWNQKSYLIYFYIPHDNQHILGPQETLLESNRLDTKGMANIWRDVSSNPQILVDSPPRARPSSRPGGGAFIHRQVLRFHQRKARI